MKYEKKKYPDGQVCVSIVNTDTIEPLMFPINNYEDLITLVSVADALKSNDPVAAENLSVFIPCFFGQRSDRRFAFNESFDLRVICDIINSCKFRRVYILDPHSDVVMALINNSKRVKPNEFIQEVMEWIDAQPIHSTDNLVFVSPDAGAFKKVFQLSQDFNRPAIGANKHRDREGQIILTIAGDVSGKDCLIVDDIADGGYTFVILAEKLKSLGAKKVYLYVTHGYFNKGFEQLQKNIDKVFCTDSVRVIDDPYVVQFKASQVL